MRAGGWAGGVVFAAGLVACSSGGDFAGPGNGGAGRGGSGFSPDAAPSAASDTDPSNPHVTSMPPASPNGPTVTVPPGSTGPNTGTAGAIGTAGTTGAGATTGTAGTTGAGATTGTAGTTGAGATTGTAGTTGAGATTGTAGTTGAGATTGTAGTTGAGATTGAAGTTGAGATTGTAGTTGAGGGTGAGAPVPTTRSWPTVDCVGGPCAAPKVCVDLDFLFVACVVCGGNDQVCCPPYAGGDPWLGTCDPGLICAHNPNFQSSPPTDVVEKVCQIPGMPPVADGRLNHQRLGIAP